MKKFTGWSSCYLKIRYAEAILLKDDSKIAMGLTDFL